MSRFQFSLRTLLWMTLFAAAFMTLDRWPNTVKGIIVLTGAIVGAIFLLIEKQPMRRSIRLAGLIGLALMALLGFCGVFSNFLESR
jgi:hypothetical protein